ncbi:hypothetical protein MTR_4g017740 [Medicago truncatula]|uniref:TIR-NBS-LRR RCT1 resistance protein n=1 Tax=Medicago truncatula TaxID=3880 RepID=A0A072UGQ7_MEDTR|nr:hypothetical protein MTR_4g017740 [Medicago truncatula]
MKGRNLKSMMLSVVYYSSSENITSGGCQGVLIINYTKRTIQVYKRDTLTSFEDVDWQRITSNLEPANKVNVMVVFGEGFTVEKTTISLLYDKPIKEEDVNVYGEEDNNVCAYGGDNVDVPADDNVTGPGQNENISDDKHWYAVNENTIVSGDDVMESNKNYVVSGCENVHDNKKNWDAVDKYVIVSGDVDKNAVGDKNVSE